MRTKTNEKAFDCLINKWQIEELIYKETKNMSDIELIEYFKKSVNESNLSIWWESLRNKNKSLIEQ